MSGRWLVVPYVIGLVVVIVGVDVGLLRHNFLARLLVNVGVVLIFIGLYLRFHASFGAR